MSQRRHLLSYVLLMGLIGAWATATADDVRVGRYQSTRSVPTDDQRAPLESMTSVRFPDQVATVGQALEHLLPRTGFALAGEAASDPAQRVLLSRPLPDVHRELGPLTTHQMLEVLAGPAWSVVVDPVHRLVAFDLQPTYRGQWEDALTVPSSVEQPMTVSAPQVSTDKPDPDLPDGVRERIHVAPGDTVSAIAHWLAESNEATAFQWMHAIFDTNRERFGLVAGEPNMNRLAVGTVLHIPEPVPAAPVTEARALVVNQYRQWQKAQYPMGKPSLSERSDAHAER